MHAVIIAIQRWWDEESLNHGLNGFWDWTDYRERAFGESVKSGDLWQSVIQMFSWQATSDKRHLLVR